MVEVIVLRSVGVFPSRAEKDVDQEAVRGHDHAVALAVSSAVLVRGPVVVGVEDAGIALAPQQDQGVGQGLEPRLDRRLEGLKGLRVVVVHEGHAEGGAVRHEGASLQASHVVGRPVAARVVEFVVEGHREHRHPTAHAVDIPAQGLELGSPVLAHHEQVLPRVLLHGVEPLRKEPGRDVLDRVQAEAVHSRGVEVPLAPLRDLAAHLLALEVEVAAHEEGEVAPLQRHLVVEGLSLEEIDGVLLAGLSGVVVHGVEMARMPLEAGVLAPPAGEMEVGVGKDLPEIARAGGRGRPGERAWPSTTSAASPPIRWLSTASA